MVAFTQLMPIVVIVFGGVAIVNTSLDLADLVTYLLYIGILVEPIQRFANFARLYQEGITGFDRFMDMMEVEPDIQDLPDAIELTQVHGHVEFRDVSFKYKEDCDHVLKNISLDIQAGEYIALVGMSGVGKTTLCSLIPRFYEVTAGQILLDGLNIRDIRLCSLRKNIGIVQQDVYLFAPGRNIAGWEEYQEYVLALIEKEHRCCAAGCLLVCRDRFRQYSLRQTGCQSGRNH
jgi:ATP-binding cassette subfamily B protein